MTSLPQASATRAGHHGDAAAGRHVGPGLRPPGGAAGSVPPEREGRAGGGPAVLPPPRRPGRDQPLRNKPISSHKNSCFFS